MFVELFFFDFQIVANIAKIFRCVSADITLPKEMPEMSPLGFKILDGDD